MGRRKRRKPRELVGGSPFKGNAAQGIRRRAHTDPDNPGSGRVVIGTVQDVGGIVEANKAQYAMTDERARWRDEGLGQHVARIPTTIYWRLKRDGILDDDKRFKKWLNDPDNRMFRTRPGEV